MILQATLFARLRISGKRYRLLLENQQEGAHGKAVERAAGNEAGHRSLHYGSETGAATVAALRRRSATLASQMLIS